jgi:hypothetical protein
MILITVPAPGNAAGLAGSSWALFGRSPGFVGPTLRCRNSGPDCPSESILCWEKPWATVVVHGGLG